MRCTVKGVIAAFVVIMLWPVLAMAQPSAAAAPKPQLASTPGVLDVPMFPLDSLQAGMKGTGYTVVRGTEIQPFNVEILELIPKGGYDGGPLILARFSGEPVE